MKLKPSVPYDTLGRVWFLVEAAMHHYLKASVELSICNRTRKTLESLVRKNIQSVLDLQDV